MPAEAPNDRLVYRSSPGDRLGSKRKEARLRYLQNYWTNKVRGVPNIVLYTPTDPARSCAIANVGIKAQIRTTDWPSYVHWLVTPLDQTQLQIFVLGWASGYLDADGV